MQIESSIFRLSEFSNSNSEYNDYNENFVVAVNI